MEETLKIADVSFSTADAELPRISFDGSGDLYVEFEDWQEKTVHLKFREILGFEWDECDLHAGGRDDVTYEIINSKWLHVFSEHNIATEDFHHYKLCFNASGNLDVLFKRLEVSVAE